MSSEQSPYIPITVFTGFLGAGKTSIILSLLPKLSPDYKVVLLKNEFGDVEVDSQLAKQSSLAAVSEILNGCMCCILVGQMKTALLEIREKFRPDRIIIECSGSAFPATLAFQIRELERETNRDLRLDAIVTVIDAENFSGYEDNSPTARMQASYTDLILINKSEHISERSLDILIDHLNTLNDLTPKILCEGRNGVDPGFLFGLDSKLFMDKEQSIDASHHSEVETATIHKGRNPLKKARRTIGHQEHVHGDVSHPCDCNLEHDHNDHRPTHESIDGMSIDGLHVEESLLVDSLSSLSKETTWRVKGFIRIEKGLHILNWAFGRFDLTPFDETHLDEKDRLDVVKFTVMGERGEVKKVARKLAAALGAELC
ncbi:cobW-domain-containing protein [Abortiporus biennis]|nr:cobW-domain-containing protein [Abortiporus biennis]